jgi:hypothetical protein
MSPWHPSQSLAGALPQLHEGHDRRPQLQENPGLITWAFQGVHERPGSSPGMHLPDVAPLVLRSGLGRMLAVRPARALRWLAGGSMLVSGAWNGLARAGRSRLAT